MFNLTGSFKEGYAESQIGEGGVNANNNCIPTAFSNVMMALGYPDIEPQDWTNAEYGNGYYGYTNLDNAVTEMRKAFTNPPQVEIVNPNNNWDFVNSVGAKGEPCVVVYNAAPTGNLLGFGAFHGCVPIRCDDNIMVVLNSATGQENRLTKTQYANATYGNNAGSTVHFFRSVKTGFDDMSQQDKDNIAALMSSVHDLQQIVEDQKAAWADHLWVSLFHSRIDDASLKGLVEAISNFGFYGATDRTILDERSQKAMELVRNAMNKAAQ